MNTIIIICIDHRKRTADRINTTEDRMAGTKRFHSSFRHFKSFRKIGKFLVYIGDLHNFTHAVSDTLSEVCLIFFFYDKYNFLKSCSFCIINRKIHNNVPLCINRVDLLQTTISTSHSCCHDYQNRFFHCIFLLACCYFTFSDKI